MRWKWSVDLLEFCEGVIRMLYVYSLRKGKPSSTAAVELLRDAADPSEVKAQVAAFLKEMKGTAFR